MTWGVRWFSRAMAVLGALALAFGLWRLGDTGSFDPFPDGPAGSCKAVETGIAISDAVLDAERGVVYLAGFGGSADEAGAQDQGALYVLDLRDATPRLQRMTATEDLHPSGLGFYRGPDGARTLFVIDHHPGAERVKIFDVAGMSASPRETISDPAFRALRDIAPTGPRQFYATNAASRLIRPLETLFGLPLSDIVYFDGTLADPAAKGLSTARGLVLSADGTQLYVAEALPHRIRVYARDAGSAALHEKQRFALRAVPDKLDLDAEGRVWLTGQSRLFRRLLHRLDARFSAPSQILELDPATGAAPVIYADDGKTIADARVAVSGEGVLLVAEPTAPTLLLCRPG